jgi:hypothetical protein
MRIIAYSSTEILNEISLAEQHETAIIALLSGNFLGKKSLPFQ